MLMIAPIFTLTVYPSLFFFFFNDTATTEIYTLSLHDALPISRNFSASVGEPPHSYLTRWRTGIAAQLVEETDLRLSEIASRVGYRSEFSFSRALDRKSTRLNSSH